MTDRLADLHALTIAERHSRNDEMKVRITFYFSDEDRRLIGDGDLATHGQLRDWIESCVVRGLEEEATEQNDDETDYNVG